MKGVSEIIAIVLIMMIVAALAALAYTWFSGIFRSLIEPTTGVVAKNYPTISSHDVVSFMKSKGCDSLFLWADGTLNCMKNDCIEGGYCKMNYVLIKE